MVRLYQAGVSVSEIAIRFDYAGQSSVMKLLERRGVYEPNILLTVFCPHCDIWGHIFASQRHEPIKCGACQSVFYLRKAAA